MAVTCEGMSCPAQKVSEAESLATPGERLTLYRDFAKRNRCTAAGSAKLGMGKKVFNTLVFVAPGGSFPGRYAKPCPPPGK